jgi:hypothetical protein
MSKLPSSSDGDEVQDNGLPVDAPRISEVQASYHRTAASSPASSNPGIGTWSEEHAGYIAAYNALVESEGLTLEQWRSF